MSDRCINLFYVAQEVPGEFCKDTLRWSPLIKGPFPKYDPSVFIPCIGPLDELGKMKSPALEGDPAFSSPVAGGVPGLFAAWRGFHRLGEE